MTKAREILDKLTEQHAKQVELIVENEQIIDSIAEVLAILEVVRFELDSSATEMNLSFTGTRSDLEWVWRGMRKLGFEPDFRPDKKEPNFSTWWRSEENRLVVWMMFSSSQCKRIQVGTKTVEQPIYEVQCDSELAELGV